jgi:hypothetical protein
MIDAPRVCVAAAFRRERREALAARGVDTAPPLPGPRAVRVKGLERMKVHVARAAVVGAGGRAGYSGQPSSSRTLVTAEIAAMEPALSAINRFGEIVQW